MFISKDWESTVITDIAIAVHVDPANGNSVHKNRPYHGLIFNSQNSSRNYYFSNGVFLPTEELQLFYLPKGSSYKAYPTKNLSKTNTCYAINFSATLDSEPFAMSFRNPEPVLKLFKNAVAIWKRQEPFRDAALRKIIYEIILAAASEQQKKYSSSRSEKLILPAVELIRQDFTRDDITVAELSALCGISEAYFRRIFLNKYGVSPKDYIIGLRMEYAKQLLAAEEFSVSAVSSMCGYSEPTHFSREFSRRVGVSPSSFKNNKNNI